MTHPIDDAIFDVIHAARAADTFEPHQALELTDDLLSNVRRAARKAGERLAQRAADDARDEDPFNRDQQARSQAISHAAISLQGSILGGRSSLPATVEAADAVIRLATWIHDGDDTTARYVELEVIPDLDAFRATTAGGPTDLIVFDEHGGQEVLVSPLANREEVELRTQELEADGWITVGNLGTANVMARDTTKNTILTPPTTADEWDEDAIWVGGATDGGLPYRRSDDRLEVLRSHWVNGEKTWRWKPSAFSLNEALREITTFRAPTLDELARADKADRA